MDITKQMSLEDVKNYLSTQGIVYQFAQKLARQVKITYPHLGRAISGSDDVRADLELIELIHHVKNGRFKVSQD